MKRRGFLGFMAGAAVAGPGMAKQAIGSAASGLEALQLGGSGSTLAGGIGTAAMGYAQNSLLDQPPEIMAREMLAKVIGITAAQRSRAKRRIYVQALDPDIAGYRSIALHAKIDWQRERQLQATIDERKTIWQRMANGIFKSDDDDLPL